MKSDPYERPCFVGSPLEDDGPSAETPHPAHTDAALERWWAELPRGRRRQALLLAADDTVPEDLVVTLLLYGILTAEDLRPLGRVPQPPQVRRLIARELLRATTVG